MSQVLDHERDKAAPRTEAILRAVGVRKTYRMGDSTIEVLKGIDLTIRPGEFLAIEGRSGSGKSTLLHILGGLDSLDKGEVKFNGADYTLRALAPGSEPGLRRVTRWILRCWIGAFLVALLATIVGVVLFSSDLERRAEWSDQFWFAGKVLLYVGIIIFIGWLVILLVRSILHRIREAPLCRLRNQEFGFVFQFYHLLPELNVLENTQITAAIGGMNSALDRRSRRARAKQVLEQLGMGHRLKHRPAQLSGGERQRVAIARALMNNPKVLFADEPTGNLDAETGRQIMKVFEDLHRDRGQTIVMVTHDRTLARRADRVLVLRDGKIEHAAEVSREK